MFIIQEPLISLRRFPQYVLIKFVKKSWLETGAVFAGSMRLLLSIPLKTLIDF